MNTTSWRNTFDSNHKMWWTIDKAFAAASTAGYPYIAWNGNVYDVLEHTQTGRLKIICTVEKLKG